MQIQLNLDLTDEQYKELMDKSFQTIFNEEETTAALRKTIVDAMAKYISDNPAIITDYFKPMTGTGYWSHRELNPTIGILISEAAKEAEEAIKDSVYNMLIKTVQDPKTNLPSIMLNLLTRGIMEGMMNGTKIWMEMSAASCNQLMDMLQGYNLLHDVPLRVPNPDEIGMGIDQNIKAEEANIN